MTDAMSTNGRTDTIARPDTVTVTAGDTQVELPVVRGKEGDDAIDIGRLAAVEAH